MRKKLLWIWGVVVAAVIGAGLLYNWLSSQCLSVRFEHGLVLPRCPDGDFRMQVQIRADDLRRGARGRVAVTTRALYTVARADDAQQVLVEDTEIELALIDAEGQSTALEPEGEWSERHGAMTGEIILPDVPDGDYTLRATAVASMGQESVELKIPLYAPARIHLLTDRPLYEPGNTVKFRAVVLRASDLGPIDGRPGRWIVLDPQGHKVLDEAAPAGPWGVAAGSFPLDQQAPEGTWTLRWQSGDDLGEQTFTVEPFTLPRFSVEASAERSFYQAGETPVLKGTVTYASGAPVPGAAIALTWRVGEQSPAPERWPLPTAWLEGQLPAEARTGEAGRFSVTLPEVPADVRGQTELIASIAATDPAGERVASAATVLLSRDSIEVAAITEFPGGLVSGANNRVYLRVTTAAGEPLPGATIAVRKVWQPSAEAEEVTLDEDSVARLQLDPGRPTSIVIDPMPVRRPPRTRGQSALVRRSNAVDLVTGQALSLDDQAAADAWLEPLAECARWVPAAKSSITLRLVAQVDAGGRLTQVVVEDDPLSECAARVVRGRRLVAGAPRLVSMQLSFRDPGLPSLRPSVQSPLGGGADLRAGVERAALEARGCLPAGAEGAVSWPMSYRLDRGQTRAALSWMKAGDEPVPAAIATCIERSMRGVKLSEPADQDSLGLIQFRIDAGASQKTTAPKPRPTVMTGYELGIAAQNGDVRLGDTVLRLSPGTIPELRVRASQVLARPGDDIELSLLRGPSYRGELPRQLTVAHRGDSNPLKLPEGKNRVSYSIPEDAAGWFEFAVRGQRALVYVDGDDDLELAVEPDQPRYAPGQSATLKVSTAVAGQGQQAAVGLFGVDRSMAQLAPLPGADAMADLRPQVTMEEQAFGILDGQALMAGRIRGRAAAEATVLKVSAIPGPEEVDISFDGSATTELDPVAEITTRFFDVLAELYRQTHRWEEQAGKGETLTPQVMAKLWAKSVDAVAEQGKSVEDAFGRRMRLHRLPEELLVLTAPRAVASDTTRLPEDMQSWQQWVERNRP